MHRVSGYQGRRPRTVEVAGPYRSQSSVPAIRRQATPREHRNVWDHVDHLVAPPRRDPFAVSLPTHPTPLPVQHQAAREQAALVHLRSLLKPPPPSPEQAYETAVLHGREPPTITRSLYGSRIYDQIVQAARKELASHENLKADPLAELAITSLATAGLGGLVGALGRGAESAAGAAEAASAARAGSSAASLVQALRNAPSALRAAGLRGATERLGSGAAAQALAHPLITKGSLLGAAHAAGIKGGGTEIPYSLLVGHARALLHPTKTIPTTGRALAGALAAPLALGYSGVQSAIEGNPAAFENTANAQIQGMKQIGKELLSGNPNTVQRAVENDVGLSFLAPLPAITRTRAWEVARSRLREVAKARRGTLNEAALRQGLPAPWRYGPGEQHVFGALERRALRREAAVRGQRAYAPQMLEATHFTNAMLKEARRTAQARSAGNLHGFTSGDLVHVLAELGTTPERAMQHLQDLEKTGFAGTVPRPGDINVRAVLDEVKRNPQILNDPKLWQLVHTYRESTRRLPSAKVEGGQRAARLLQAKITGTQLPEHMVPEAVRKYTQAPDRAGAWRDLQAREAQAAQFRKEAHLKGALANHVEPAKAAPLRAESKALYGKARALETQNKEFRSVLSEYSGRLRNGTWDQTVSSRAIRKHWDPQMMGQFVKTVDERAGARGYVQPVITHHAPFSHEAQFVGHGGNEATRVQHIRGTGPESLAFRDAADRSLRGLIEGSVIGPRVKEAGKTYTREMFSEPHVKPVLVDGQPKLDVTKDQFDAAVSRGEFSPKHFIFVPNRYYKQGFLDPFAPLDQLPENVRASAKAVQAGTFGKKGELGRVLPLETFKEVAAQTDPVRNSAMAVYRAAGRGVARTLLFSTGWVLSQIAAEGLPVLMANPKLLNPVYLRELQGRLRKAQDLSPQEAMAWGAVMGESRVRTAGAVQDLAHLGPMTRTHRMFYDAARAAEHNPVGRAMFSIARQEPLQAFNVWQSGYFRKILAAAEVDRSLNGWLHGLQGALRIEKGISDELRHLPPEKQILAFAHPRYAKALDQLANYVDSVAGNWTAFTRFERAFAPAMIFYGFLRFAARWPLTFAREHPVTASVNYLLAQANANQIRKILGENPSTFLGYSYPVVRGPNNEPSVLPVGSRITPGLSGPSQGALEGNAPAAALSSLNPLIQMPITLLTGETAFGTHDTHEGALGLHLSTVAQNLVSMPPIMRLFGLGQSNSPASQELRRIDPHRTLRSVIWPYLPESGSAYRRYNQIVNSFGKGGSSSTSSASSNPWDSVNPSGASSSSNPWDSVKLP